MSGYLAYIAKRLAQFALVVFIGINLAYVITHATPIDPVEQSISAVTSFGNTATRSDRADAHLLRELYGLEGSCHPAICGVLETNPARRFSGRRCRVSNPGLHPDRRALALDYGTSRVSTTVTWVLGNWLGGLAGYYQKSRGLEIAGRDRHGSASDSLLHSRCCC